MTGRLLIRTDGGPSVGHGHAMRCLALAQAWRARGGHTVFAGSFDPGLEKALRDFELVPIRHAHPDPDDLSLTGELLASGGFDAVVVDGYGFDAGYQRRLRGPGRLVLVVDDTAHLDAYDADALLNQNIGAEELDYPVAAEVVQLLGPRYALLREEFLARRAEPDVPDHAARVLVTVGGGSHDDALGKITAALESLDLEVRIAAGLGAAEMAESMAWADLAVTGAGSTCWELAFMGVPFAAVVLAPNQGRNATGLAAAGAAVFLGPVEALVAREIAVPVQALAGDRARRAAMSTAGQALVDGLGAARVAAFLSSESPP